MALLCTFDGPKGVGKSTVIKEVSRVLGQRGWQVSTRVEKDILRAIAGPALDEAHAELKTNPSADAERVLAHRYREARVQASARELATDAAEIILLDRWYPSDAVFRTHLDPIDTVNANLAAGVRKPDVVFAVLCEPATSWARAHGRERSLDSRVITSDVQHAASTSRFESAASLFAWRVVRTDHEDPSAIGRSVADQIETEMISAAARSVPL